MQFLIGLLAFIFMLSFIIIIHEAGHFMAARHFGVYVHEFSLGMGPALYQKKGKETTYSIRAIPFGGYVMMAGEQDGSQDEEEEWLKAVPEDRLLHNKKTWQQIVIMAAGVFMNIVLAAVLYVGLSVAQGYVIQSEPVIDSIVENMPADQAGLQAGDRIVKIEQGSDSVEPQNQSDISVFINLHTGTSTFTIERDGETFTADITPVMDEESQVYVIGYQSGVKAVPVDWLTSVQEGLKTTWKNAGLIFESLKMLVKGQGYENLSGPLGILDVTTQTASLGFRSYLSLFALISLNIGIFNLIPIPALDGGRIVILLVERLFKRKISQKVIENIILASFILLIGLFLFATYNDLMRIF
jgi:regulator of sigma E protease